MENQSKFKISGFDLGIAACRFTLGIMQLYGGGQVLWKIYEACLLGSGSWLVTDPSATNQEPITFYGPIPTQILG